MLYESTQHLLQHIVQSLEASADIPWEDDLEFGSQCIYELYQMSRHHDISQHAKIVTAANRSLRAIPHVKLMNSSLRHRDRTVAIQSGRKAIAEMAGAISGT